MNIHISFSDEMLKIILRSLRSYKRGLKRNIKSCGESNLEFYEKELLRVLQAIDFIEMVL